MEVLAGPRNAPARWLPCDHFHVALTSERYEQAALIRDQIEQPNRSTSLPGEGKD